MQNYSYWLDIRIWHPSIDPDEITRTLGITPDRTMRMGEKRMTPKGQLLDGMNRETYWVADPFGRGECLSTDYLIEDLLLETVEVLSPHKAFLLRLREEGGRIHLMVSSFSARNYAFEVPPVLLRQCADLGLSLVHDVYPSTMK